MNRYLKIVIYGFLVWLVPFAVSFIIYPMKTSNYPLFESILSVVIAMTAIFFSYHHFKGLSDSYIVEGITAGFVWFLICIAVDLMMFLPASPMQMSFMDYIQSIGSKYLIIPAVTIGMAYMAKLKDRFEA